MTGSELRPKFIDVHPAYNSSGYIVTNEEPETLRGFIAGKKLKRSGGIASGGEILLSVLLPQSSEVVVVDHAYNAVTMCYIKSVLLASLGPQGFLSLLTEKSLSEFQLAMKAVVLPPELAGKATILINDYNFGEFKREWKLIPAEVLDAAHKKLDKVTLIHGDLADLQSYGEFNCIYASNAFEHTGRGGIRHNLDAILPLVKTGGMVLSTHGNAMNKMSPCTPAWDLMESVKGKRATQWTHAIYKKKRPRRIPTVPGAIITAAQQQGVTNATHV